ncbi:MAG: nickel-dependent hydrogenase large subunit [Campylobacterales bacterium]|nr:nickel-dependent hydrogenase large subunit [Campylobacterales bacterium]
MRISREIVARIEGEAKLELTWKEGKVVDSKIAFVNYRGIEEILKERHPLDALVITPRVCGICSHAHISAAVLALENCYETIGYPLELSAKAKGIRTVVLNAEKIQNHLKWLMVSIVPELAKQEESLCALADVRGKSWFATQEAFTKILKMGAIFSGQWPHGSYVMVGGVTCDPTYMDVMQARLLLDDVDRFCEAHVFGVSSEAIVSGALTLGTLQQTSLLGQVLEVLLGESFATLGRSYDRFLALGLDAGQRAQKCLKTRVVGADPKYVSESLANTFFEENGYTYSKSALYKNKYFETGPLARMMIDKEPFVRDMHRRYKDALPTRVLARVLEVAYLIVQTRTLLENLCIKEPSCKKVPFPIETLNTRGQGIVEAARGSLIHKVEISKGKIRTYDIITPTVWNLGNGTKKEPSVVQKALLGIEKPSEADLIFKGLDVCSVCTTQ